MTATDKNCSVVIENGPFQGTDVAHSKFGPTLQFLYIEYHQCM